MKGCLQSTDLCKQIGNLKLALISIYSKLNPLLTIGETNAFLQTGYSESNCYWNQTRTIGNFFKDYGRNP